jgi:hypothetical protein
VPAPWVNVSSAALYKTKAKILYPVNIGRNVARDSAVTHYILPSDIELYPSPGLIQNFLDMVRRQEPPLLHANPKVFPLPIFELEKGVELPANKTQLVSPVIRIVVLLFIHITAIIGDWSCMCSSLQCAYKHTFPLYCVSLIMADSEPKHVKGHII